MATAPPTLRIGELAARTGVSVHVLRVWERRYGLLTPSRSAGGYRLYGPQDEWRVRETARLREGGMAAAQAAATALQASRELVAAAGEARAPGPVDDQGVGRLRARLLLAIQDFDGTAAQAILDVALEQLGVEETITELVMPALHETGARWAEGQFTVAQEHFASNLVRTRLASLGLAWDSGTGPVAVLACPAGEQHDLGLLAFGVVLGRTGWRVRYLGADTPLTTLGSAVAALEPDLVALSSVREEPLLAAAEHLPELPDDAVRALAGARLVVAGAGATAQAARSLGATLLQGGPVEAARQLAEHRRLEAPARLP